MTTPAISQEAREAARSEHAEALRRTDGQKNVLWCGAHVQQAIDAATAELRADRDRYKELADTRNDLLNEMTGKAVELGKERDVLKMKLEAASDCLTDCSAAFDALGNENPELAKYHLKQIKVKGDELLARFAALSPTQPESREKI